MTMPQSPAPGEALSALNKWEDEYNQAAAAVYQMQQTQRPADDSNGHDQGGKQWDADYKAAQARLQQASSSVAAASRQYATMLQQQATADAKAADPGTQARAARAQAQADYYNARADVYAADTQAKRDQAQQRADAATQRAQTAADRVDAQNAQSQAAANNANASAAATTAETPSKIAASEASAAANRAQADAIAAKTPAEIAASQASANASNANAERTRAQTQIDQLNAQLLQEEEPLKKQQLQAQIDELQARIAQANKPSLAAGGTANDRYIVTMDTGGNFTVTPNPNYQPPKPDYLTPNTTASQIPVVVRDQSQPNGYTVEWIPNQNQQTVKSSILGMYQSLASHIGDLPDQIPLDTAKDLMTSAYNAMTAETNRQQTLNQGAQVGAGMLNQRVQAAGGLLNNILGIASGNKNLGLGSQADLSGLPAAISGWLTQLGGGASTYQTAQDLVHAANPTLAGTPAGAGYTGILSQMLDKASQQSQAQPAAAPLPPQATPQDAIAQATFHAPYAGNSDAAGTRIGPTIDLQQDQTGVFRPAFIAPGVG